MSFFRRPHRKTRSGCVICKQRRIKCDEARPICLRCKKRNLPCSYNPVDQPVTGSSESTTSSVAKVIPKNEPVEPSDITAQQPSDHSILPSADQSSKLPHLVPHPHQQHQAPHHVNVDYEVHSSQSPELVFPEFNDDFVSSNQVQFRQIYQPQQQQHIQQHLPLQQQQQLQQQPLRSTSMNSTKSLTSLVYAGQAHPNSSIDSSNYHSMHSISSTSSHYQYNPEVGAIPPGASSSMSSYMNPRPTDFRLFSNPSSASITPNVYTSNYDRRTPTNSQVMISNENSINEDNNKDDNKSGKRDFFVRPEFLSNKTYSEDLKQYGTPSFFEYIFYSEINFKLNFYVMNTLPFKLCRDPANRLLFATNIQVASLYDFLFHALQAVTFQDLYYQQIMMGTDDVLNLQPNTYLELGDYHLNRSLELMSTQVKTKEDTRKSVALIVTSTLQIKYNFGNPKSSCSTKRFYGLGESLGLLFADSAMAIIQNDIIRDACARYCINEWSLEASDYFAEFLYGILDVQYNSSILIASNTANSSNQKPLPVQALTSDQLRMLSAFIDRLKKEYRAYANQTVVSNPITLSRFVPIESLLNDGTPIPQSDSSQVIEYDMLGTLSRFIVDVPREFIELLDQGDPRALILSGYNIIALASRSYPYWPKEVYAKELSYIDEQLDKLENGNLWKTWLDVARNMVDGL